MISRLTRLLLLSTMAAHAQDGGQLFTLYCSACHGADANGGPGGAFPPLAGSPWVAGDADRAVKIVLKGLTGPVEVLGKTYNLEMPPQGAMLPDDQVAAIVSYVRSSFGNKETPVSAERVKAIRDSISDRSTPWTAAEILKLHPLAFEKTALSNLISQVYSGNWTRLPDFSTLKPNNVEEEHDGVISLKNTPFEDNFAKTWQGDFTAPADGEYTFFLDADDAAAVAIDGKIVAEVKPAGPMDGSRAVRGKISLTQGVHKFRAEFLEIANKQGISLSWKGPQGKQANWLSERPVSRTPLREPIPIEPVNGRPVIYRNFIAGTSPRAIGVGFPGGFNLAWSADNLGAELIWTGAFLDGAAKWTERGTDSNPPAGDDLVSLSKTRTLPKEARFRGYKLDKEGNPTFAIQLGTQILLDSWSANQDGLIRKVRLNGSGPALALPLTDHPITETLTLEISDSGTPALTGPVSITLTPEKPGATITYRWKK